MKTRFAVLGVAAIAAVLAAAGCSDGGDEQTLELTEPGGRAETFGAIGDPSQQGEPGSGFTFSTPLQESSKKRVGQIDAACVVTRPSTGPQIKGTCTATATVPHGTLALNLGGTVGEEVSGAIVGGTGEYTEASGTFTSASADGGGNNDTFDITLP